MTNTAAAYALFVLLLALGPARSLAAEAPESIISRTKTDLIFSLTRHEWEKNAEDLFARDWKVRSIRNRKGNILVGFHPSIRFGISLQALFENNTDPPVTVIVGNYFPRGAFPVVTKEVKNEIQTAAQADLGPRYLVGMDYFKAEKFEVIELTLKRAN